MEKKIVNGIRCLVCNDKIWSHKVHDFKRCKCCSVAIEGGQRYLKVTGLKENYELIKIEVSI